MGTRRTSTPGGGGHHPMSIVRARAPSGKPTWRHVLKGRRRGNFRDRLKRFESSGVPPSKRGAHFRKFR
eukprot:15440592-Alexandrium_andersonii.AAC.1